MQDIKYLQIDMSMVLPSLWVLLVCALYKSALYLYSLQYNGMSFENHNYSLCPPCWDPYSKKEKNIIYLSLIKFSLIFSFLTFSLFFFFKGKKNTVLFYDFY